MKAIQYVRRNAGKASLRFFESCDRSGDILAGVAVQSGEERVAAQFALADLPLRAFLEDDLISYESDEITHLIADMHDAEAFAAISHLTVGDHWQVRHRQRGQGTQFGLHVRASDSQNRETSAPLGCNLSQYCFTRLSIKQVNPIGLQPQMYGFTQFCIVIRVDLHGQVISAFQSHFNELLRS